MNVYFWYLSLMMIDVRYLHSSCRPRCDAVMDKRFIGYRTLQFMQEGAIELWYGQRRHHLAGRWAWPHHPGPRIRLRPADGPTWHHRHLAVRGAQVESWAVEGLWPTAPQPVPERLDLGAMLDDCVAFFTAGDGLSHRRGINRLEEILLVLAQLRGRDDEAPWLARAKQALSTDGGFRGAVEAATRASGLPPSTFRRRFAAATGLSPQAYALRARMTRARELLLHPGCPVAAVSEQLGYADPSLFGRQFRALVGTTPAAWRREFA